jgi:prepilin signal peptidase PulO-like enzyme (type II secretory pathway)
MCIHCGRQLKWWENVPLFSYLFLGGRCKTCKKQIPVFYVLVEFFTGVLFVLFFWLIIGHLHGSWLLFARYLFMISVLMVIFVGDLVYQVIWPEVIWAGVFGGLVFNILGGVPILSMLLGAAIGLGFFLIQYLISRGKWIGGGDVRMGAMMGVWLGYPVVLLAIFAAYVVGALVSVCFLLCRKRAWTSQIPFGPFLAVAMLWASYYGDKIIAWYTNWLR